MSFDLKSKADDSEFEFTGTGWSFCLILAREFDWLPEGTKKPKDFGLFRRWHGRYDSSEGQTVSSRDSSHLAAALQRALKYDSLEDKARKVADLIEEGIERAFGRLPLSSNVDSTIDDQFHSYYKNFIEFCRKGEFTIN